MRGQGAVSGKLDLTPPYCAGLPLSRGSGDRRASGERGGNRPKVGNNVLSISSLLALLPGLALAQQRHRTDHA